MSFFLIKDKTAEQGIDSFQKNRGIKSENFDHSIDPNHDFYQYSNGNWLKNNPIPPIYSRWGGFVELFEENDQLLKRLLENVINKEAVEGTNLQKVKDFFSSVIDTKTIEDEGVEPLKGEFKRISSITNLDELQKVIAHHHTFNIRPCFMFFPTQDSKNSDTVIPEIFQGGIGLPERDYYLKSDDESRELLNKYIEHVTKIFELIGYDSLTAKHNSEIILNIEKQFAEASMTQIEMRDPNVTYNKMSLEELEKLTPNFSWKKYFTYIGLEGQEKFVNGINIGQPEFFKAFDKILVGVNIEDWKIYLEWNLVNSVANVLSSKFVDADFHFNYTILNGVTEQPEVWRKAIQLTNYALGEAVGQLYVEEYFSGAAKEKVLEMVENIKDTLRERIKNLEWMQESTKQKALLKLDKMSVKIGYPNKWKDYTDLKIGKEALVNNMMNVSFFKFKRNLNKIGKPVNKEEWYMSPQTVNAYYSPQKNEIVFPAAILQPPFFDLNADDALNYGGIGAVIGHEITHGFDDQGRRFDENGNLVDWWTKEDEDMYNERAKKMEEQFSKYIAIDTLKVNGELTLGENIADLGGLTIAYQALQKVLKNKNCEKIDGFTPEQRFFLSWSQIWRMNIRPEALKLQVLTDPHTPNNFRVNGPLSNMKEFREAFNGKEGDPMIKPEHERIMIW